MKIVEGKFLRAFPNKWREMGNRIIPCWQWALRRPASTQKQNNIPRDVPKGHLVVYVGDDHKRFVIKMSLLNNPLFKALLDQAQEEYDFTAADSKLCIPCDETIFLSVVRCATSPQVRRISLCL